MLCAIRNYKYLIKNPFFTESCLKYPVSDYNETFWNTIQIMIFTLRVWTARNIFWYTIDLSELQSMVYE